ncbi:MAG: P-loop domain-containing protein [Myxococcota bacterium]
MKVSDLRALCERLDGRPYGHYRELRGRRFELGPSEPARSEPARSEPARIGLRFEHVQGDPFAAPSRVAISVPSSVAGLPDAALDGPTARRASADFVQRALARSLQGRSSRGSLGSGKSGLLEIAACGQEVLERSGVWLSRRGDLEIRLSVGLPAAGRRILGRQAGDLLAGRLSRAIEETFARLDLDALRRWIACVEDQAALRAALPAAGLVAFLAEGSLLPRRSGADPAPLDGGIPLEAPDSLAVELEAPHAGRLRGLGIREGVTLIVGGGYHGKSTLLQAIALCVYDHIPGDGRERCVTRADAVTIRAEDGRSVCGCDLRAFIGDLPLGRTTRCFDTRDASGSTSQAAAIVEALEAGASALLVDEDTAATNFMVRDARMRQLVPDAREPITPFLDRVRQLHREHRVSTLLVIGGAGDYLDVATHVIQMDSYRPLDATARAREVAARLPLADAAPRDPGPWPRSRPRIPDPRSLDASRGRRPERVRGIRTRAIEFGREEIDVSLLHQLVDPAQCRMVGDALLALSRELADGRRSIPELLDALDAKVDGEGLQRVAAAGFGDRARARRFEIAAALNRLRSLRLVHDRERRDLDSAPQEPSPDDLAAM